MKKISLLHGLMLTLLAVPFVSLASTEEPKMVFEENKNQWPAQVKFKADIPGGALFLERNTFTYELKETINWHRDHRNESGGDVTQKMHCIKVHFENSNPNSEIFGNKRFDWHRNYYIGNDPSKWASDVPVYAEAYYKNLYADVDLQYYNVNNNLKYDIIVHPGGNPKNIKMNYEGTDGMYLDNGHLIVKTTVYDILESKPYAYQVINGQKKTVQCDYALKNNIVTFEIGDYDRNLPLVIDPALIAATYTGSTADNWGFTATYDAAQNIYIGGIISGTGYPTTAGAHDNTYNGGTYVAGANARWPFDIFLAKFNPTGTGLLYATYYGGITNEQPHSIMVNGNNELYVVGRTNSNNFPNLGAFQPALAGGYDIIVGKFNSTGGLMASTYLGGASDDCINVDINWDTYGTTKFSYTDDGRSEIILDANSNVYVAANTRSANFPTAGSAYQTVFGGTQDAVVFKMNSNLSSLMWSTYLGGNGTEAAYGLKLDNSNNVYVTGGTTGGTFPTGTGTLHPNYMGGLCDGFITVFNPSLAGAAQLLRTTFLGTASYDQSYMIEIDASGDLYVYGQSQGGYPVTAGVYSNAGGGMFVHKLTGNLQNTVFSTVIGSGGNAVNISPTAFLVDSCQTIYLAGWGRSSQLSGFMPSPSSTIGLTVTGNAIQGTTDGKDHYFCVLQPNAKGLFYATFYGENNGPDADHVDGGTSRFDKRGVIYEAFCASCGGSQAFPVMPGAYSTTNNCNHINYPLPNSAPVTVFNCNEAVVKMDVSVKPLAVASLTGPANGCAPFTVSFNNSGSSATNYIWDFGDGGVSYIPSPSHIYTTPGTYTITLYAIDSIGICGYIDTALVAIQVGANPTIAATATNISCAPGVGSATVTVTPTGALPPLTYLWSPTGGNSNIATGLTAGCYSITVSDALACSSTKTVCVNQPPPLSATTASSAAICGQANGTATVTVTGGTPNYTYSWLPGIHINPVATGLSSGNYTVTVTDSKGCTSQQVVNVAVAGGPSVTVTQAAPIACNGGNNGSASASIVGGTGPYTYAWSPIGGNGATATGLSAGAYNVVVIDANGCSNQGSINISAPPAVSGAVTNVPVKCFGGNTGSATAVGSGGTGPYTYVWGTTPPQNTATANNLASGTYSVVITDSKGCTSIQYASITQPVGLFLTTTSSGFSCGTSANGGATASVQNGTAPYSYNWQPINQTTPSVSNIPAGTYTVTVTDANGCTIKGTTTIVASIKPTADFTSTPVISCEGVSIQFVSTSLNALTYNWTFNPGLGSSTVANPSFPFPYNGSYTVTLIVTNPPCSDTLSKPIVIGDIADSTLMGTANVFTPNSDGKNDCFHPALKNAKTGLYDEILLPCTYLEVFDRWGVKMYETLGPNGINCWDGNNRNDSKPAKDGTYFYIATLGKTTIKGYVTLARHK